MPPITLAPTAESERIHALDLVRGVALLGILFVNIQVFGEPFGSYTLPHPEPEQGLWGAISYYFVAVFCAGKFYTLFSMLFGIGLAIQWTRAQERARNYTAFGARRMLALMVIGLLHALLIWYGDILFAYSLFGLLTLPLLRARPRTLVAVSMGVLFAATLAGGVFTMLTMFNQPKPTDPALVNTILNPDLPPFQRFWEAFSTQKIQAGPADPLWTMPETEAMRDGPYSQAFAFRALSFGFIMLIVLLGMGWTIWSMFLLGIALYKSGAFTTERLGLHRRFATICLPLGLALVAAGTYLMSKPDKTLPELGLAVVLAMPGSVLMSLGYLGSLVLFAHSRVMHGFKAAIARVGRMGLTNYLLESGLATFFFYHWGLGFFGQTTRIERMGLVLAIYLLLIGFSALWLRHFRFGPMEWLWRTLTYLRPQPMRRSQDQPGTPVADL
jgi:uncharacterized protein